MEKDRIKILYLLRGLPGSGKTTLGSTMEGIVFESDMYFRSEDGTYNYNPKNIQSANNWCHNSVMDAMEASKKGSSELDKIIVSNNFTTEKEMEPYYKMADRYGFHVFSVIVENRHSKGGYTPPEVKVLAERFETKLL